MANSYSVVSIDQTHFDNRLSGSRIGRKGFKKKLYSHTTSHTTKDTLSSRQVDRLIKAAMHSPRNGSRDAALILLAHRHGFKVSELINLKWEHIDFENQRILVSRLSNGEETLHTLDEREIDFLHQLEKENTDLVFRTQRNLPMSSAHIRKIIKQAGEEAGFKQTVYPNMITGASGFDFLSAGAGYHSIRH